MIATDYGRMKAAPTGVGSTSRSLTRSSVTSREGLAMKATRRDLARTIHPDDRYRRPKTPLVIPAAAAERAATRYEVDESTGCWISTYSRASHGYAQVGWSEKTLTARNRMTTAHRAAWVHHSGKQIPEGMTVDHMCKNRPCVNPGHLRLLTNFENARRTSDRDWPLGRCINGHPNSELREFSGRLHCRICEAKWREDHRGRTAA